jgi:hypothetical protein
MSAAWESFHKAAYELASYSPIKQRLILAFSKHLKELSVDELPAPVRTKFKDLAARMTSVKPLRGETAVCATVRKMSNNEAGACAQAIVDLLGELAACQEAALRPPARRLQPVYTAEA